MRGGDMTRSILLVTLAAAALAAVATVAPRFSGGTVQVEAQDSASLALDMDITNGSGPCNPIDTVRGTSPDQPEYKVAICLTDSAVSPGAFEFTLVYDDTLDQCVPVDCVDTDCLDGNPDANLGATVFSSPNLGTGWDCDIMELDPPACDRDPETGAGHGKAFLKCLTLRTPTLPTGLGVSVPIAVVAFKTIAKGSDTFTLENASAFAVDASGILSCYGASLCSVGTTTESSGVPPTGTPGASGTPGATGPPAGTALAAKTTPSAVPTASEEKQGGEGGTNAGVIAVIVVGALVVVGGMGWFAWRRLRLR